MPRITPEERKIVEAIKETPYVRMEVLNYRGIPIHLKFTNKQLAHQIALAVQTFYIELNKELSKDDKL